MAANILERRMTRGGAHGGAHGVSHGKVHKMEEVYERSVK